MQHLDILRALATVLSDPEPARLLRETTRVDEVLALLTPQHESDG